MYTRLTTTFPALFSIVCLTLFFSQATVFVSHSKAEENYMISDIKTDIHSSGFIMAISGNSPPAYTVSERFDPFRIIVDIARAEFNNTIKLEDILPDNKFSKLHLSILKDQKPPIARFEFTLSENTIYDVQRVKNGLELKFSEQSTSQKDVDKTVQKDTVTEKVFAEPETSIDLLKPEGQQEKSEEDKIRDSFSFSGYNNERISVDFYKIDLHNVFRLFRQITDLNIIVDEAVNGTITLALTDVPWDFALDIILNLADLKKEERYNTIVVYPKNKEFLWPQRAADNLSLEVDAEVIQEEALIIEQSTNQPVEIMQAKELLVEARQLEKKDDYEDAAILYEKAAKLWPENSKISNKLANLYLGRINQSAKAYHFAKKTLEKNPADTKAALYCAIASANMDKIPEALDYFAQSISNDPPMKEALVSYAAFSEKNNQPDAALKLLNSYTDNYGDTVHIMVSKARILDKIGEREKATAQYKALLTSGFQIRPDLKKFVEGRIEAGNF